MADITVILTAYRRPHLLLPQIAAIRSQTISLKQLWLWANEPNSVLQAELNNAKVDRVITCTENAHVHARFALALTAPTEYVAVFDDDTFPGEAWFENCLTVMRDTPGILGTAGVHLIDCRYTGRKLFGWHSPSNETVEVDLVGHAWFLRQEWLQYLFSAPATTANNGEDIELSARAWRLGGIRTYCPPHPVIDKRLWGSLRGTELGTDAVAASRSTMHLEQRDTIVQAEIAKGWQPLFMRGMKERASIRVIAEKNASATTDKSDTICRSALTEEALASSQTQLRSAKSTVRACIEELIAAVPADTRRLLVIGPTAAEVAKESRSKLGIEAESIAIAADKKQDYGALALGHIVTANDFEQNLIDFAGGSFDCIICDHLFEYLQTPQQVLGRLITWLVPGGTLISSMTNIRHHSFVAGILEGIWPAKARGKKRPQQIHFFTLREYEKLHFRAGLELLRIVPVPNPLLEQWRQHGKKGSVKLGRLHIDGLLSEDAEEFYVEQYCTFAKRPSLFQNPATLSLEKQPLAPSDTSSKLREFRQQFKWPKKKPKVDKLPNDSSDGWLAEGTRELLARELTGKQRIVLELGAWLGLSARFMLDVSPESTVITVDHWRGSPEHHRRKEWKEVLPRLHERFLATNWSYQKRLIPLKMTTIEGIRTVADHRISPDVIFFDAEHRFESLMEEIRVCHELFPAATLIGDDYDDPQVSRAVHEFASKSRFSVDTCGSDWRAWKLVAEAGSKLPWAVADYGLTSIVIVTFNQLPLTQKCLESIRLFTDEPYEIIVVDNASTDGTVDYLRTCGDVRLIANLENSGFPRGANQGMEASRGRQVLLLNNDVIVTTGWLRRLLVTLNSDPQIGLVGPCSNYVGSSEQQVPITYDELSSLDGFAWEFGKELSGKVIDTDRLVGFCLLIKRALIDRIGYLDERFGVGNFEDDDYCRRARQNGFRAVVARDAFIHHFGHASFKGAGIDLNELLKRNESLYREKWNDENGLVSPSTTNVTPLTSEASKYSARAADGGGLLLVRNSLKLSLCMIVRDNADTIGPCLDSIRPHVDEMIVVDTGSKDETPRICASFGATVFHLPWPDCFSTARNESLKHARGDWIFWMDSDDTISDDCGQELRKLAYGNHPDNVLGYVIQVHCPGPSPEGNQYVTVVDHVKLFRNRSDLRFEGRIHEQIIPAIRRAGGDVAWTDLFVTHSGYDHSPEGQQRKIARDLHLLQLDMKDRPNHPFVLFNLGMTYADAGRHEEAVKALRQSLVIAQPGESQVRKAYAILVGSLTSLHRYEEAWLTCQQGKSQFPLDPELSFRQGVLAQKLGRFEDAERAYIEALANSEERHFTSIDRGITGYKARHNLAALFTQLGRFDAAEAHWLQTIQEAPDFVDGWRGLIDVLFRQGKQKDIDSLADECLQRGQFTPLALTWKSYAARLRGDFAAAAELIKDALSNDDDDPEPLRAWCQLAFEIGDPRDAEAGLIELVRRDPLDPSAHHNLGTVYLQTRRYREAVSAFQNSVELRPSFVASHLHLGYALDGLGERTKAIAAWRAALQLDNNSSQAIESLARYDALISES